MKREYNKRDTRIATLIALVLLVVMATTILMGRAFAKYISTASGTDSAQVAKWTFTVNTREIAVNPQVTDLTISLFDTIKDSDGTSTETDVKTETGKKIIAPGTSGSFDLVLNNPSQVNATYTIALKETEGDTFPIQYQLVKDDDTTTGWSRDIASILEETSINMGDTKTVTVMWRWVIDNDDAEDTALGIAARDVDQKVTIKATITATQVD